MQMSFSISIENDGAEDAELTYQTQRMLDLVVADLRPVTFTMDPSLASDVGNAIGTFVQAMKSIERRAIAREKRKS